MRIEDNIRNVSVTVPARHQELLRARLQAHAQTLPTQPAKKMKWAVPIAGLAVIALMVAAATIIQPQDGQRPNIAQNTVAPLSTQQVLAAASAYADKNVVTSTDTVYYQKKLRFLYNGTCVPYQEYNETYTRRDGFLLKDVRKNMEGRIIESVTFNDTDSTKDTSFFDQSALDPAFTDQTDNCPPAQRPSKEDERAYEMHMRHIAAAYGFTGTQEKPQSTGGNLYLNDVQSGDMSKQAKTLKTLQALNEWKVEQNVSIPKYFKEKVIVLSYDAGPYYFERLYFSQKDQRFLGSTYMNPSSGQLPYTDIIVEQGTRPMSKI